MRRRLQILWMGFFLTTGASNAAFAAGGSDWLWVLAGNLSGVYTPVEGRPLAWSVSWANSPDESTRRGELMVSGNQLVLHVGLVMERSNGRISWEVKEGRVGVGEWLTALAGRPEWGAASGVTATGELTVSGRGEIVAGVPAGEWSVDWAGATVRNESQGWTLEGVTFRAGGSLAELMEGTIPVEVRVGTVGTERFGARNFAIIGAIKQFRTAEVARAQVEIAGGEVTADPFVVALQQPKLSVTLNLRRVGLQDLVVFVPTRLADARGRINGQLHLDWSPGGGVQVGAGSLSIDKDEPTTLRLAASPGFLTEQVPARFTLAPAWLGPIGRLFQPANPSYETLSRIELGKLGLRVVSLDVRFTPEGDQRGRSATVFIHARPEQDGSVVELVTFEINVSGPLAEVLRLGMEQTFSVDVR